MIANSRPVLRSLAVRASLALGACVSSVAAGPMQSAGTASHSEPITRRPPDDLAGLELDEVRLVERVLPTVVTIRALTTKMSADASTQQGALGTGVLVGPECHVLTAAHVVEGAQSLSVRTHDGVDRAAHVLFSEPGADIALLQLSEPDDALPHADLGDSDRLAVGQRTYVIGNPRGLMESFTAGHVSAFRDFNRLYDGTILVEFLQTDAAINSGNSGGPVFDSKGRVIGIASRILTQSGGSEGLGFAITINSAKKLMALETRGWTGFEGVFLDHEQLGALFHLDREGGLLVQSIVPDSPAAKAGLRGGSIPAVIAGQEILLGGDLILQVGDQQACHGACLAAAHDRLTSGDARLQVTLLRDGQEQNLVIDTGTVHRNYLLPR